MYDFHLHSDFSIKSKSSMEDMAKSAIEKNLKSICFTDHVDFESSSHKLDIYFRTSDYFKNINKVKYKYKKNIEILAGVEIGIQPHLSERYNEFIVDNPFDFVIASIHNVKGKDIYFDDYLKDITPLEAIEGYYSEMYESIINFNDFDVLGHIDFLDRHFHDTRQIPRFDEYQHLVKKVLIHLINKNKGLELNTAGIRHGLSYFYPKFLILKLYKELGGEIITLGSDSHTPDDVGYEYKAGEKLLKDLGFKYIYLFKDRKKYPINIG